MNLLDGEVSSGDYLEFPSQRHTLAEERSVQPVVYCHPHNHGMKVDQTQLIEFLNDTENEVIITSLGVIIEATVEECCSLLLNFNIKKHCYAHKTKG